MKTVVNLVELEFNVDITPEILDKVNYEREWIIPINDTTILSYEQELFWWEIIGSIKLKLTDKKEDIDKLFSDIKEYLENYTELHEVHIKSAININVNEILLLFRKKNIRIVELYMDTETVTFHESLNVLVLYVPSIDIHKVKKLDVFIKPTIVKSDKIRRKIYCSSEYDNL